MPVTYWASKRGNDDGGGDRRENMIITTTFDDNSLRIRSGIVISIFVVVDNHPVFIVPLVLPRRLPPADQPKSVLAFGAQDLHCRGTACGIAQFHQGAAPAHRRAALAPITTITAATAGIAHASCWEDNGNFRPLPPPFRPKARSDDANTWDVVVVVVVLVMACIPFFVGVQSVVKFTALILKLIAERFCGMCQTHRSCDEFTDLVLTHISCVKTHTFNFDIVTQDL